MSSSAAFRIHPLAPGNVALMEAILTTFGEAFDAVETYSSARPSVGLSPGACSAAITLSRSPR